MATKSVTQACATKSKRNPAAKAAKAAVSSASRGMSRAPQVTPAAAMTASASPSHEAIAQRAREIWQSGKGSSDLQNWLQAECELRSGRK